VAPGRYRVSPAISAAEERAGLLFVPAKREVTLSKSPILDVNFGQALVRLLTLSVVAPHANAHGWLTRALRPHR
jgi:hypothetical protein